MNIECSEIEANKYSEYSNYVFETFKNLVDNTCMIWHPKLWMTMSETKW